jgi:hypothetical protein
LENSDWARFQSLPYDLISPRIKVNSEEEADKAAHNFTAYITSAFRLLPSKVTLSGMKNHGLPGFDLLLKHELRLRKLYQETRNPPCKSAVNTVKKTIKKITHRKAIERVGKENKELLRSHLRLYGLL